MITVSSSDPFSGVSGAAGLETSALMGQASPRTSVRQWALPPIGRSANSSPPAHSALSILEKDLTYLNLLAAVRLDDRQNSLATLELDELRKLWEKFESDPQSDSLVATLAPASAGHDRQAMYWRNRDAPFAAWWHEGRRPQPKPDALRGLQSRAELERGKTLVALLAARDRATELESTVRQEQLAEEAQRQADEAQRNAESRNLSMQVRSLQKQIDSMKQTIVLHEQRERALREQVGKQQLKLDYSSGKSFRMAVPQK